MIEINRLNYTLSRIVLISITIIICIACVGCSTVMHTSNMVEGKIVVFTSNGLDYDFSFTGPGGKAYSTKIISLNSKIIINNSLVDNLVKLSYESNQDYIIETKLNGDVLSKTANGIPYIDSNTPITLTMNEKTYKEGVK